MFKNIIYFVISILILFPYPLDINIMGYPFQAPYILMLFVFMFLPVAFIKKSYWRSSFTKLLWAMRLVFIAIFLIASFKFGLSPGRIVSFIGYFMITFLYEIPFIFDIEIKKFFKVFNITFLIVLMYATFVIGYYAISTGSLMYSIPIIRNFLILYPNHFAILLILIFWIRQYFLEKHNKIVDIWIITLIFASLSRIAMATFLVTFIVNILINHDVKKWKKPLLLILVLSLLIPVSLYLMELKEQSIGSMLERTYYSRIARWNAALNIIKENPIIGTGFDRTTDVVYIFYSPISGQPVELGSMHNDYVDLLLKGGMIGSISFLGVLIGIFILGVKYNKSLVVLLLTIVLTAFFQNPIKNLSIMFCLFFSIGTEMLEVNQRLLNK